MGIAAMQNNPVSNIVFLCLIRCGYSCCTNRNENFETKILLSSRILEQCCEGVYYCTWTRILLPEPQ